MFAFEEIAICSVKCFLCTCEIKPVRANPVCRSFLYPQLLQVASVLYFLFPRALINFESFEIRTHSGGGGGGG